MTPDKIYILMVDGADVWVPINALKISENKYELLRDAHYDELDEVELMQFFPGDIVETEIQTFHDGSTGLAARQLIKFGQQADRNYLDFQFYATRNELVIDKKTATKYQDTIYRLNTKINSGGFLYPGIVDVVRKLSTFLNDK